MLPNNQGPDPRALELGIFEPRREGRVLQVILEGLSDTNEGIYKYLLDHRPADYKGKIQPETVRFFTKRAVEAKIIEAHEVAGGTIYLPLPEDIAPDFARATRQGLAHRNAVLQRLGEAPRKVPKVAQRKTAKTKASPKAPIASDFQEAPRLALTDGRPLEANDSVSGRLCRICWNSKGWIRPSGEARYLESGSYVSHHGFGHEEWLFNYEWMYSEFKYAFLQPINHNRRAFLGKRFPVFLYSRAPDGRTYAVGTIRDLYVPLDEEIGQVAQSFRDRGWLEQMNQDLVRLGISPKKLLKARPQELVNVRFRREDVRYFEPLDALPPDHPATRVARYTALRWPDGEVPLVSNSPRLPRERAATDKLKTEVAFSRRFVDPTAIDPKHNRLQNRLLKYLRAQQKHVTYEDAYVDLIIHGPDGQTFVEIKTEATCKGCIRAALGQLVEYSHYPDSAGASQLWVVGDAPANAEDRRYLTFLRLRYSLPIYYRQFSSDVLSDAV
jgi:hypothetical protein